MWSTTAPTTNTCTARASSKKLTLLGAGLALLLAGCVNDSATYLIDDGEEHGITLLRAQDWFWQGTVRLSIVATRMPDCRGGLDVEDVPVDVSPELYQAPPGYAEPIHILKVGERHFAVSTASCRVQEFQERPQDLGTQVGSFAVTDGQLAFKR
jgi:hypothetical protein